MVPKLVIATKSKPKAGQAINKQRTKNKLLPAAPEVRASRATKEKTLREDPNIWTPSSVEN